MIRKNDRLFGMYLLVFALALGVAMPAFGAPGESVPSSGLSLERALKRVGEVSLNPALWSARLERRRSEISRAGTWPNPVVHAAVGRKDLPDDRGYTVDISIDQQLPVSGLSKSRTEFARERLFADRNRAAEASVHERLQVTAALYRYGAQETKVAHIRERLQRLLVLRSFLYSRPLASPSRRVESFVIEGRLQALEHQLIVEEGQADVLWSRLNEFLLLEQREHAQLRWFASGPALDSAALWQKILSVGPDLVQMRSLLRQKQVSVTLADQSRYPAPALRAYFGAQRAGDAENYYGVGIALPLPLSSRAGLEVRRANADLREHRVRLQRTRRELRARLVENLARYQAALRAVKAHPVKNHGQMDQRFDFAIREFRRGRVSAASIIELDSAADDFHEATFSAQLALLNSYIALMLMSGESELRLEFSDHAGDPHKEEERK